MSRSDVPRGSIEKATRQNNRVKDDYQATTGLPSTQTQSEVRVDPLELERVQRVVVAIRDRLGLDDSACGALAEQLALGSGPSGAASYLRLLQELGSSLFAAVPGSWRKFSERIEELAALRMTGGNASVEDLIHGLGEWSNRGDMQVGRDGWWCFSVERLLKVGSLADITDFLRVGRETPDAVTFFEYLHGTEATYALVGKPRKEIASSFASAEAEFRELIASPEEAAALFSEFGPKDSNGARIDGFSREMHQELAQLAEKAFGSSPTGAEQIQLPLRPPPFVLRGERSDSGRTLDKVFQHGIEVKPEPGAHPLSHLISARKSRWTSGTENTSYPFVYTGRALSIIYVLSTEGAAVTSAEQVVVDHWDRVEVSRDLRLCEHVARQNNLREVPSHLLCVDGNPLLNLNTSEWMFEEGVPAAAVRAVLLFKNGKPFKAMVNPRYGST